jgi:ZIP family zinc transporter
MGLYAGLTVYLGFAILAIRNISRERLGMLNAMAGGLLGYLFAEISVELVEKPEEMAREGRWLDYTIYAVTTSVALIATLLILAYIERRLKTRSAAAREWARLGLRMDPWTLSLLLSIGLGMHNLGEGLGIGSALSIADLGLAILLSIGFAIHNVTEGFAISSPLLAVKLARTLPDGEQAIAITSRGLVTKLLILGLIAGGPTAVGALILSSAPPNELIIDVAMTSAAASIIYSVFNMNLSAMGQLKGDPVRFWFSIFLGFLIAIAVETALATMNLPI